ncbi:hypothetical protein OH77DRAFT_1496330 [Trametes cingulata]|nr:hypothetical protein OH77DRAFT_1496330 [Trametes cingulata]
MAVSSHRIHTIHGAFGAPSCFGFGGVGVGGGAPLAINPAHASSFTRIPNVNARSRPSSSSSALRPGRTTPASASHSASSNPAPPNMVVPQSAAGSRPRRTSVSYSGAGAGPMPTRRAPPPPPVPAERTASSLVPTTAPVVQVIPTIEDPFADALEETSLSHSHTAAAPAVADSPLPTTSSNPASTKMATGLSAPPGLASSLSASASVSVSVPSAKDMRGRLVASALLSRGSGRPLGVYLRRRLSGQEHVYVKSRLSQLVAAAA